jgi:hypothetical protein
VLQELNMLDVSARKRLASLYATAKDRAFEGAKHGAAYAVARAVTNRTVDKLQSNTALTAMLLGLPEPVRVFLVCNAVQALARAFGGEQSARVSAVVEHGMEGASTVLFASIDLPTFFKEIATIDVGGLAEDEDPAGPKAPRATTQRARQTRPRGPSTK